MEGVALGELGFSPLSMVGCWFRACLHVCVCTCPLMQYRSMVYRCSTFMLLTAQAGSQMFNFHATNSSGRKTWIQFLGAASCSMGMRQVQYVSVASQLAPA